MSNCLYRPPTYDLWASFSANWRDNINCSSAEFSIPAILLTPSPPAPLSDSYLLRDEFFDLTSSSSSSERPFKLELVWFCCHPFSDGNCSLEALLWPDIIDWLIGDPLLHNSLLLVMGILRIGRMWRESVFQRLFIRWICWICVCVCVCVSRLTYFFRKLYFVLTLITTLLRLKAALIRGEHPCYSC